MIFAQAIDFLPLIIIWMADGGSVVIPAAHWPDPVHFTHLLPNQHAAPPTPTPRNLNEPAEPQGQRAALNRSIGCVSGQ